MYYLAKWRLNNAGQTILPGSVFEASFSDEQENRLLSLGAIERADAAHPAKAIAEDAPGDVPSSAAQDGVEGGAAADDPKTGANETPAETTPEDADDDESEADEDDAPAPVIDVTEGVVDAPEKAPDQTPEPAPARKKNNGRDKKRGSRSSKPARS